MSLAANEMQKAIYTRLTAALGASPVVYDYVPQDAAYPYVVIGADTSIPWDTKTNDGQEFTCTIHAWTKNSGRRPLKTIMQNIYAALHHQEPLLTMTGFTCVQMRCEYSETIQDQSPEGDTDRYYHGIMRFRALIIEP
jgi:hypothetical protein